MLCRWLLPRIGTVSLVNVTVALGCIGMAFQRGEREGRISEIEPIFISTIVTYTGNLVYLTYEMPLTHSRGSALLTAI